MSKAIDLAAPWPLITDRNRGSKPLSALLALWLERACQRRQLAELTTEQLSDIGVMPEAAQREAAKPFWQA